MKECTEHAAIFKTTLTTKKGWTPMAIVPRLRVLEGNLDLLSETELNGQRLLDEKYLESA